MPKKPGRIIRYLEEDTVEIQGDLVIFGRLIDEKGNIVLGEGSQGPPGPAGEPGAEGLQGAEGLPGPEGAPGLQGGVGPQGNPGSQGGGGGQGQQGNEGPQGVPGAAGGAGSPGLVGPAGPPGAVGGAGAPGTQGEAGAPGAQGSQGIPGAGGATGLEGATGAAGGQGIQGISGAAGGQGTQGIQGIPGTAGTAGGQGIQGIPGTAGAGDTVARKTSPQVISAAGFVDVTELTIPVAAGQVIAFEFFLIYQSSVTTMGVLFALNGPASPVLLYAHSSKMATAPGVASAAMFFDAALTAYNVALPLSIGEIAQAVNLLCVIRGVFANGPNVGTFAARLSKENVAGNATVMAGSFVKYRTLP